MLGKLPGVKAAAAAAVEEVVLAGSELPQVGSAAGAGSAALQATSTGGERVEPSERATCLAPFESRHKFITQKTYITVTQNIVCIISVIEIYQNLRHFVLLIACF